MERKQSSNVYGDIPCLSYAVPSVPVTDKSFVWTGAAGTDVRNTWRKFGWKPVKRNKAKQPR